MPVIGITGGIASGKSSFTSRLSQLLQAEVFDADATARELVENNPEVRLLIREQFGPSAFLGPRLAPRETEGSPRPQGSSGSPGNLGVSGTPGTLREIGNLGEINRQWLRDRIFSDEAQRRKLEAILHPAIRARWQARAKEMRGPCKQNEDLATGGEASVRGENERKPSTDTRGWLLLDIPLLYEAGAEAECDAVVVVACREETQVARIVDRRGLDPAMARKMIASQTSLASKAARADYVIWNDAPVARLDEQAELFAGYLKLWMKHLPR